MEPFGRSLFGSAVKANLVLAVLSSIALALCGRAFAIPGLWAGVLWISANVWMIHRILRSVSVQDPAERKRVYALAVVKFPVLYVAGLFILLAKWVALEGVFWAFTLFFVSIGSVFAYTKILKR